MDKKKEKMVQKFQVIELEQRLEMAKWSLSAKGTVNQKTGPSAEISVGVTF